MKVKLPFGSKSHFNLSNDHVTTFEFGQARPTYYRFMSPNEKLSVDLSMMCRCSPMVNPAYGNVSFKHRAFFVPIKQISPAFDKFFNGVKINVSGYQSNVYIPQFALSEVLQVFLRTAKIPLDPRPSDEFHKYGTEGTKTLGAVGAQNQEYGVISQASLNALAAGTGPSIYVENLFCKACINDCYRYDAAEDLYSAPSDFAYDFVYYLTAQAGSPLEMKKYPVYCKLKPYGRFVKKVFDSLGYNIHFPFYDADSSAFSSSTTIQIPKIESKFDPDYNAFNLLAFIKVLFDRYVPAQFAQSSKFQQIFSFLQSANNYVEPDEMRIGESSTMYDSVNHYSVLSDIMFKCLPFAFQLFAGNNYFSKAWYNQDSIVSGVTDIVLSSRYMITNAERTNTGERGVDSTVLADDNGTFFTQDNYSVDESGLNGLQHNASSAGHKWLNSLYNLFKRTSLAGTRTAQLLLSTFGVRPSSEDVNESIYLGTKTNDLQIMDVTQSASTEVAALGQYAGKAFSVAQQGNKFEFETKNDWGIFIVVSSVNASGGFVQGIDRQNLILGNKEFFNPTLEKQANEPIRVEEFLAPPTKYGTDAAYTTVDNLNPNYGVGKVFGFASRYAWAKNSRDFLTGDFNIKSLGGSPFGKLNAWHTFRMLTPPSTHNIGSGFNPLEYAGYVDLAFNPVAQGQVLYSNGQQFNRLFNVASNISDHFFCVLHFDVHLISPMLSLEDSVDIDGFREVEITGSDDALN